MKSSLLGHPCRIIPGRGTARSNDVGRSRQPGIIGLGCPPKDRTRAYMANRPDPAAFGSRIRPVVIDPKMSAARAEGYLPGVPCPNLSSTSGRPSDPSYAWRSDVLRTVRRGNPEPPVRTGRCRASAGSHPDRIWDGGGARLCRRSGRDCPGKRRCRGPAPERRRHPHRP